jgi:hypothetical protein
MKDGLRPAIPISKNMSSYSAEKRIKRIITDYEIKGVSIRVYSRTLFLMYTIMGFHPRNAPTPAAWFYGNKSGRINRAMSDINQRC